MNKYITNCPNCGAPLRSYGRCEYCGTAVERPLQILTIRPGLRKLVCQTILPTESVVNHPEASADYTKHDICAKMTDALIDSIKFVTKREFNPSRCEDVITVHGELWVADPDINY